MLEDYKILTVTHRQTNVKHIGQFVVQCEDEASLKTKLHALKTTFELEELMYLSTCNRVLYFFKTNASARCEFSVQLSPEDYS